MTRILGIEDTVRSVLHEALDLGSDAGVGMSDGFEIVDELRREFPEAKIVTISLSALIAAVQESIQSEVE